MDWNTLSSGDIDLDENTALLVSGSLTLDISGFVLLGADFAFSQTTGVSAEVGAAGGADDLVGADLLSFSLTDVNFFAGSGASFDVSDNENPIVDTTGAVGLAATGGSLELRILSGGNAGTDSYTGITGSLTSLSVVGVSGLTLALTDLQFASNSTTAPSGAGTGDLVDWNTLSSGDIALDENTALLVSGSLTLDISGFVLLGADFAFSQTTGVSAEVGAAGGADDLVGADLLSFSLTNVNFFAGSGASFDVSDIENPVVDTTGAVGLAASGGSLELRILSGGNAGTDSYTGITGQLNSLSVVGVSGLTLALTDLKFAPNSTTTPSGAGTDDLID